MFVSKLRQYKLDRHRCDRIKVGERDGFTFWCCFATSDHYIESQAPNTSRYSERNIGMGCSFAVQKDDVWCIWKPGWGIDIHWPSDKAPEYLGGGSDNACEYVAGGRCRCDGSSLADGERAWPAFNHRGLDGVFATLIEFFP